MRKWRKGGERERGRDRVSDVFGFKKKKGKQLVKSLYFKHSPEKTREGRD